MAARVTSPASSSAVKALADHAGIVAQHGGRAEIVRGLLGLAVAQGRLPARNWPYEVRVSKME
jgi:hypothetical protein